MRVQNKVDIKMKTNRVNKEGKTSQNNDRKVNYSKLALTETGIFKVVDAANVEISKKRSVFKWFSLQGKSEESDSSVSRSVSADRKSPESPDSGLDVKSTEDNEGPSFDLLFESPEKYPMGVCNPATLSRCPTMDEFTDLDIGKSSWTRGYLADMGRSDSMQQEPVSSWKKQVSRSDSVMESSLSEILARHWGNSGGFGGFRRRVGHDISHKYCSFCRCDEVLFLFLYVVFGIIYISAGTLGVLHCPDERPIAYFLLADGFLSVFIFPITIVEWTKRIGGCVQQDKKLGHGFCFIITLLMRIAAAIGGTFILVVRSTQPPEDELFCYTVHMLLEVGVAMEWAFLFLVILLPLLMYSCAYWVARTCLHDNILKAAYDHEIQC